MKTSKSITLVLFLALLTSCQDKEQIIVWTIKDIVGLCAFILLVVIVLGIWVGHLIETHIGPFFRKDDDDINGAV